MRVNVDRPGKFGGEVRRKFTGAGREWLPGDKIKPSDYAAMKPQAAVALERGNYVSWYKTPEGGDRLPETISVVQLDGTVVTARLEREDGELVGRVVLTDAGATDGARAPRRGKH